ncbi:YigZ family protein [Weissella kandleri]|uniref:YigZ family protein n=1 Tax=Weissella kandleri TaxID=1616 RepID=UPI00387E90B3
MVESYITIAPDTFTFEQVLKKSRFIVDLKRVSSEDEARDFIALIKKLHPKANHHVWAYTLGPTMEVQRASDDGEPSGTAAGPMLEVIKNNELHDIVAVQTRYFGGIKLGAGGLIRAYAGSLVQAVEAAQRVERIEQLLVSIQVDYAQLESLQYWLTENAYVTHDISYAEQVTLQVAVDQSAFDQFEQDILDQTKGRAQLNKLAPTWIEVPYLRSVNGQTKTRR